ncbi:MAG: peptidylprolyl isomerase [bacterium]|nr:peptidylprolyl isomerase [bacterium]
MKAFWIVLIAAGIAFAGCGKSEKADTKAVQKEEPKKTEVKNTQEQAKPVTDTPKLEKWPADYPVDGDSVAVIEIEQEGGAIKGTLVCELYPDKAPNHVRNFKWLADHNYYDGVIFHRVIKGFMIQGGDPTGTGSGGPGWNVNAEFNDRKHEPGTLSMARTPDPNSAGSQFFVCHVATPHLDNQYTVFGKTIKGMDIVNKIAETPVQGSTPLQKVKMKSVRIVSRAQAGL